MNIVEFEDKDCEHIRNILKGKTFFAVSMEGSEYYLHIPDHLSKSQIIFGIELMRQVVMNDDINFLPGSIDNET